MNDVITEWLTFGEMVDRIQIGQVAEPDDKAYATIIRTPIGIRVVDRWTRKPWDRCVALTYSKIRLKYRFTDEQIEYERWFAI